MPTATSKGNTASRLLYIMSASALIIGAIGAYGQDAPGGRLEQNRTAHQVFAVAEPPSRLPHLPLAEENAFAAEEFTPIAESPTWAAAILATALLLWSVPKRWKKSAWVRIANLLRSQFNWLTKRNGLPEGMRTHLAAK